MAYQPKNANGQATMANSEPVVIASDQSAVPVSGTVTANLSATDNAVLDDIALDTEAIKTAVEILDNAIAGTEMQVDIVSAPTLTVDLGVNNDVTVTSGSITEANSGSILSAVDGLEASNSAIQTAVQLLDDAVQVLGTDTYTEAASKGITLGAVRHDADTTLVGTTNEFTPLQVDANGRLKVEAFSGETLPVSLSSTTVTGTVAVTQSGTWDEVGINDSGNSITVDAPVATPVFVRLSDGAAAITTLPVSLASVPSHAVTNAGTFAVQVDGTALTALQLIDDTVFTDDTGFTAATSKVNAIGLVADESATDSVDEGDIGAPRMTLDRKQITTVYAHSTGGMSVATGSIAATKTDIGSANVAGAVYGWYFYNPNSSVAYVQFFNAQASAVTLGTTAPVYSLGIPATSGANVMNTIPINHSTAISIAVTTTRAGSTGPGSTLDYNIFYKQ